MQIKNVLVEQLKTRLKPSGYFYDSKVPGTFIKIEDKRRIVFFLGIKMNTDSHNVSTVGVIFLEVEEIMNRLSVIPGINMGLMRKEKTFHTTIRDKNPSSEKNLQKKISTEKDIDQFVTDICDYVSGEGKKFIEKYNKLSAILKEMDDQIALGKLWNEILDGGPEFLLRGLIVSKLSDDPKYFEKLTYVEKMIELNLKDDRWKTSLLELKGILNEF